MSKKPDFTFLDVGIPKGEILKPKFPKGKPVIWKDKNVTKVIVEDDKTVRCNDEFVLFSELTKDIMDSQGSNTKTGVQSSSRWTWKGKQLDVLHSTVYTSRKLVTLLNNDFNQALPMYGHRAIRHAAKNARLSDLLWRNCRYVCRKAPV